MTTEIQTVGLKSWQWLIVLLIALAGGALGGYFAGGINGTINENRVAPGSAEVAVSFEVDEDD